MTFLTSILSFIAAIAILVAIHEFGHFWVARKLGVKVLRFSIGFGKPLYKWVSSDPDKTEYVLAAVPLGGYVKMLDEREGEVPANERHRAFNRQSVWTRIAVVAAGPLANFLLAILVYSLMYMVGVNGLKPVIGEVMPDSVAARADVPEGALIKQVNGKPAPSWESATLLMIKEALKRGEVELLLQQADGSTTTRMLNLADSRHLLGEGDMLDKLGLAPWRPRIPAVFKELVETGAAARAGLKVGDEVVKADGKPIHEWREMVSVIRAHPGKPVDLAVRRHGRVLEFTVTPDAVSEGDSTIGRIGALPRFDPSQFERMRVKVRYGPVSAVLHGVQRTWDMSVLTVKMLWKMVAGEASLKNISGPLTIAQYAGVSASIGLAAFLGFLGIVSVSLGVLNLMPIPVLDGGHLFYYLIELIKGGPLSPGVEAFGQRVGLALLGGLMFVAFYNDISRMLG